MPATNTNLQVGKVRKPARKENLTKREAASLLAENTEKIVKLNSLKGIKQKDYDEISKRLFEEKRKLLNILKNL